MHCTYIDSDNIDDFYYFNFYSSIINSCFSTLLIFDKLTYKDILTTLYREIFDTQPNSIYGNSICFEKFNVNVQKKDYNECLRIIIDLCLKHHIDINLIITLYDDYQQIHINL